MKGLNPNIMKSHTVNELVGVINKMSDTMYKLYHNQAVEKHLSEEYHRVFFLAERVKEVHKRYLKDGKQPNW